MEYFKKKISYNTVHYYAVKDRLFSVDFLVVKATGDWWLVENGYNLPPDDLEPIEESHFLERYSQAIGTFEKYIPKPL